MGGIGRDRPRKLRFRIKPLHVYTGSAAGPSEEFWRVCAGSRGHLQGNRKVLNKSGADSHRACTKQWGGVHSLSAVPAAAATHELHQPITVLSVCVGGGKTFFFFVAAGRPDPQQSRTKLGKRLASRLPIVGSRNLGPHLLQCIVCVWVRAPPIILNGLFQGLSGGTLSFI